METAAEHFQGDYYNQTTLHPVGIWILVALSLAVFLMPRRWALVPMLLLCCFVSPGQRVVIATVDFTFLRIIGMVGWLRVMLMREHRGLQLNRLDWVLIGWAAAEAILGTAVPGRMATIYFVGAAFDAMLLYFLARVWIRGWDDIAAYTSALCVLAVPVAAAFLYERSTGQNAFAAFGGVPEMTDIRDGRLRCQGAFAHPILAGCFWAAVLPLMVAIWYRPWHRPLAIAGLSGAMIIILMCASSTPLAAALAGAFAWGLMPMRRHIKLLRWVVIVGLIGMQAVMSSPLWHLLGRIDLAGGSTGWHRYRLIDQWIKHWREWFFIGSRSNPGDWGAGLFDVTNHYIVQSLHGGILQLGLFTLIIYLAFSQVGGLWRYWNRDRQKRVLAWALGISLFVHALNFVGVSYFGQITALWYLLLGSIAALAQYRKRQIELDDQPDADHQDETTQAAPELIDEPATPSLATAAY
jgi:hypothetical protein